MTWHFDVFMQGQRDTHVVVEAVTDEVHHR